MVPRLRLLLPVQGVWVQSLVRELRSHMPCEMAKKFKKRIKKKMDCEIKS